MKLILNVLRTTNQFAADNSEAPKASNRRPKSPRQNLKLPLRSTTPSQRPSILSTEPTKSTKGTPIINYQKPATDIISTRTNRFTNTAKSTNQKEIHMDSLTLKLSKKMGTESKTKPRSRGVSPLVRSTIPAQIPEFSNETPPNLRTDRSTSATRGRPGNPIHSVHHKPEPSVKPRRESGSPSVIRGRKVEYSKQESSQGNVSTAQKGGVLTGNGTHVLGSRMVDKVMNARKSGAHDQGRETKPKSRGLINESSDFGRIMSKSSLDIKFKRMVCFTFAIFLLGNFILFIISFICSFIIFIMQMMINLNVYVQYYRLIGVNMVRNQSRNNFKDSKTIILNS